MPSDTIEVSVEIDMSQMGQPDHRLGSFSCTISWDPTVLSYTDDSGLLQNLIGFVNTDSIAHGKIRFNGVNPVGVSGSFTVIRFSFFVSGEEGSFTTLNIEYSAMAAAVTFNDLIPFLVTMSDTVYVGSVSGFKRNVSGQYPQENWLGQNYPNPFNPTTSIPFSLVKSGNIRLYIHDILGRQVAVLLEEKLQPGNYEVVFTTDHLANGQYFYTLVGQNFREVRKMVLLR
jgi:hypothetical protein